MILEINKLIESNFDMLYQLGWLLYNRDNQDGGLTKEELNELLHIINEQSMEKEYQIAYNEGLEDGSEL